MEDLLLCDPQIGQLVINEARRQTLKLELIASENFVSPAVRQAQGSILTHKYAEGYPGKRYYGGCKHVDAIEDIARERAKSLFNCEYVNVQPHSGSQANMAAYFSFLKPGDTVLGMNLAHGGHLTHGSSVNFSGRFFNFSSYGVNRETGHIDYEEVNKIAQNLRPKMIVAGASAYPGIIDFKKFHEIAESVNAILMADMAHIAGLVAAGCHPSPVPFADIVTSTTHKTLRGPRGGMIICKAGSAKIIDAQIFPGMQGGPLMHIIAAKAVAFGESLKPAFKRYIEQVLKNAKVLANALMDAGFNLVSGGTDNHLMLIDLTNKNITGKEAELALDYAGITVNKNAIPFDALSPFVTSGIRIGTPALTTRGMKENEMLKIAAFIIEALEYRNNQEKLSNIRTRVAHFCRQFPLFEWD